MSDVTRICRSMVAMGAASVTIASAGLAQKQSQPLSEPCIGSSWLVYDAGTIFVLSAPRGWVIDCMAGAREGLATVAYPAGESWQTADAAIYAAALPRSKSKLAARIDSEVADWLRLAGPASVRTDSIDWKKIKLPERIFRNDSSGKYEAVAYMPGATASDTPLIVLTARSAKGFANALPAFKAVVGSFCLCDHNDSKPPLPR